MHIDGQCHCGNIAFALEWPDDSSEIPARACDCTFCVKHAGVWTSNPNAKLVISVQDPAAATTYEFGTKTAQFHVCAKCGTVPVVSCRLDGKLHAVVNVNTFVNLNPSLLRHSSASFGAEELGSRLGRRARNWISEVEFATHGS